MYQPIMRGSTNQKCPLYHNGRAERIQKKETMKIHRLFKSGYCDSNTGPSGPKPDALANCATPR